MISVLYKYVRRSANHVLHAPHAPWLQKVSISGPAKKPTSQHNGLEYHTSALDSSRQCRSSPPSLLDKYRSLERGCLPNFFLLRNATEGLHLISFSNPHLWSLPRQLWCPCRIQQRMLTCHHGSCGHSRVAEPASWLLRLSSRASSVYRQLGHIYALLSPSLWYPGPVLGFDFENLASKSGCWWKIRASNAELAPGAGYMFSSHNFKTKLGLT